MELGEGHHADRCLTRQPAEIPFLLLADEDGCVEQTPQSSSTVPPTAARTSSSNP